MRAQKRDANEPAIISKLDSMGCSVDALPGGNGRPDLLVGDPVTGLAILMEVKVPLKPKLNPLQKQYHADCRARIHLVTTPETAEDIVNHYRKEFKHG
jgi:hypothetical protein